MKALASSGSPDDARARLRMRIYECLEQIKIRGLQDPYPYHVLGVRVFYGHGEEDYPTPNGRDC